MDFNTDSIVTAKAKNLLPITIMERQEGLIDAWEQYYRKNEMDRNAEQMIKARLNSLHLKLYDQLKETNKTEDKYKEYLEMISSNKVSDWKKATDILLGFLYSIGLTRLPMTKKYDMSDVEAENEAFEL